MGSSDDFKNFLIIQKIEEDNEERTFLQSLLEKKLIILASVFALFVIIFLYKVFFTRLDLNNIKDKNYLFQINNGVSVSKVAEDLKNQGVIKSVFAFKFYLKLFGSAGNAQAGIYKLNQKDTLVSLANKIKNADYAIPPVRITIIEGAKNGDVANIISKAFLENKDYVNNPANFDPAYIYSALSSSNSFIFPDTYLFLPNTSLDEIISDMQDNFYLNLKNLFINLSTENNNSSSTAKIYSLNMTPLKISDFFKEDNKSVNLDKRLTIINQIGTTTVTIRNIVTMASYLEGEANNEKDMRIVAGVLWTRLKLNYPLQIDAATSTYKTKGFTKNPINNPGMVALRSAIDSINTGNIYYITGNDGNMYYAKDYETHLKNINRYLRK
ncbi:MAG: Endolytic murein transglycosylase [Patescibacteria group bacterium]|nr:Endolytic murein transglycosylase [Patescibacteria group bacterium]